ncbi:MAG: putative RNA-binding protein (virulence factor B family) [Kiritimatiellia bacterium]|jgi:predicted RNA-binding protein (virulence factor B family)
MIRIGQYNELTVARTVRIGLYLTDGQDDVLLPMSKVPDGVNDGDTLRVFVYTDSDDRIVATTDDPMATVGEIAALQVVDIAEHGAFLDWGLEKDLFVPWREMHVELQRGDHVVVGLRLCEHTQRVLASSRIGRLLDYDIEYMQVEQEVELLVYGFNAIGALVLVDGRHAGLLYRNETWREVRIGQRMTGYVKAVRDDNKLDVSLQKAGPAGIDQAQARVLSELESRGGYLPLHDKSSPEAIRSTLQMSKKSFKRAIGGLYKNGRITFEDGGIRAT